MTNKHNLFNIIILTFMIILVCSYVFFGMFNVEEPIEIEEQIDYQNKLNNEMEENEGKFAENKIVLSNVDYGTVQLLAKMLDAKVRTNSQKTYSVLTLPNSLTVKDVVNDEKYTDYLSIMSLDHYMQIEEVYETAWPDYDIQDTEYSYQVNLKYMNIGSTWETNKGKGVKVAVIDSGIDVDHPDLIGKASIYSYYASGDKIVKDYKLGNDEYDWSLIDDDQGHGTAVAGTICAAMNNVGVTGIAPEVELIFIKCDCDSKNRFVNGSDIAFGLYYAIEQEVDIVNMSIGGGSNGLADALQLAVDSDILVVASAGNDSTDTPSYPAADPNCLGVGALEYDSWDLAWYSNFGINSDIVAPGTVYTTKMGGGYGYIFGTSFACPSAVGAIALLMSQEDHVLTYNEITELIFASSLDLGEKGNDLYFGYGAIDVDTLLHGERGKITFNYLTDELETTEQVFIRGHVLQNIPNPERLYAVFNGWYYDIHCFERLDLYNDKFYTDITLYAKWENEDDGIPYTYVKLDDDTIEIQGYTGKRRYITIPEYIEDMPVTSISSTAFAGLSELRMVNLPNQLKRIGPGAFSGCSNLLEINIPKTTQSIENGAFSSCIRLKNVNFDEETVLSFIGDSAFSGCSNLRTFTVPKTVEKIYSSSLACCYLLTDIFVEDGNTEYVSVDGVLYNISKDTIMTYPAGKQVEKYTVLDSVKWIDSFAFAAAPIDEVIAENIEAIGISAFAAAQIKRFEMPDSVVAIGKNVFKDAQYLEYVRLSNNLTEIPKHAFENCVSLQSLFVPKKVCLILEYAFSSNYSLSKVEFEEESELTYIDLASFFAIGASEITIPKKVTEIEQYAFGYSNLSKVYFEENSSLNRIGQFAFTMTQIDEITLPKSVEKIERAAFGACFSLKNVYVEEESEYFTSVNGVLYSKDKKSLFVYGAGRPEKEYTILDTVEVIEEGAFYWVPTIEKVNFSNVLTTISKHAFYKCSNVENYIFPASLKYIEEYAFSENTKISNVYLPKAIYQISNYAFGFDTNLEIIEIEQGTSLPRLSYAAFTGTKISTFTIPASVSTMAQGVFENCLYLREIIFEDNSQLEYVAAYMFNGCDNLETIDFGEGSHLKNIEAHAFEGMTNIRYIDFKDAAIENIDNFAFRYCESLENITIPETVTYIGRYSFFMCKQMTQLGIPVGVKDVGEYAFYGTNNINIYFKADVLPRGLRENWDYGILCYYIGVSDLIDGEEYLYAKLNNGNISIIKYKGDKTTLDLTSFEFGSLESIGGEAFANTQVKEIVLPNTVKSILMYAFNYSNVEKINIPSSVEYIGRYAFTATPLSEITIESNSNLYKIEQYAFAYCKNLKSFVFPESLETLGSYVFYESGLNNIAFEDGIKLKEIPEYAFYRTNLESVVLPNSLELINHNAFREIATLEHVTFGFGKLYVMANVFYHSGLKELYIPSNLEYIGEYAFVALHNLDKFEISEDNKYYTVIDGLLYTKNVRKLIAVPGKLEGTIYMPRSLESIGFGAFEDSKLTNIIFDEDSNILTFGYRAFYNMKNLKEIKIPKTVISIDFYAFAQCENLETVIFDENGALNGIYEGAFYGCRKLKNITFPDEIYEISDYALAGCLSLDHIPVKETTKLMGIYNHAFENSGVRDVVIPESVIDIGDYAFKGCKIESIVIPNKNVDDLVIGIGAFEGCIELKELTIPFIGRKLRGDSNNYIGYIFGAGAYIANNTYLPASIEKITISYPMTEICEGAFYGCENLKEIVLPDTVVTIGYRSFYNTHAKYELKNPISYSYHVRSVTNDDLGYGISGKLEFAEQDIHLYINSCPYLVEVIFPDGMENIDGLGSCYSLKNVAIGKNTKKIGLFGAYGIDTLVNNSDVYFDFNSTDPNFIACRVFRRIIDKNGIVHVRVDDTDVIDEEQYEFVFDGDFRFIHDKNGYQLIEYTGIEEDITLPKNINGYDYTIHLTGQPKVKSIIIPEGIDKVDAYAFAECISVEKISLPSTIKSIGERAFYRCENLKSINFPEGLTTTESEMCRYCNSLTSIELPSTLTTVGYRAFYECESLKSVYMAEGIEYVSSEVFAGCKSLEYVYIPSTLVDWNQGAFFGPNQLVEMTFANADNFTIIDDIVYNKSVTKLLFISSLKEGHITIPNTVTELAFTACEYITGIDFPEGIKKLPNLSGCKSIVELDLPDSIEDIDGFTMIGCTSLTKIKLPASLKHLGNYVFSGCDGIRELVLPDALEDIGGLTCENLTRLVIPENVTNIQWLCFNDCPRLIEIVNLSNYPLVKEDEWDGVSPGISIAIHAVNITKDINNTIFMDTEDGFRFYDAGYGLELISYLGNSEEIVLPTTYKGEPISYSIRSNAFSCNGYIKKVTIPSCVNVIGASSFDRCYNLETVIIEDGVKTIGGAAFENCEKLATVVIPDSITSIGKGAFNGTYLSNDITNYPDGALYIGNNLIKIHSELQYLYIRPGITCIADDAFENCFKIKEVRIGGDHMNLLRPLVNLERLVITEMPDNPIYFYFFDGWNLKLPITLKEIVLEENCVIKDTIHFDYLGNITIYTEENELDFEMRAKNSQWHGGYTVYYGDDWQYATFNDQNGNRIAKTIYLNFQVLRLPYYLIDSNEIYDYSLTGWDMNNDGVADAIPATIVSDTVMNAIVEKTYRQYKVVFMDKDNMTIYKEYYVTYGEDIPAPDDLNYKGYTFNGWIGYSVNDKVTRDVTYYPNLIHLGEGHNYVFECEIPATCIEGGYNKYVCSICDEVQKEYTSLPLGHSLKETIVNPECEIQGYTIHKCDNCDYEYKDNYTPALEHDFGDWIIIEDATCTNKGTHKHICSVCKKEVTESIEAKGHTYKVVSHKNSSCIYNGYTEYECEACHNVYEETLQLSDHNYQKIKVRKSLLTLLFETVGNILFGYEGSDQYIYRCSYCGMYRMKDETENGAKAEGFSANAVPCKHEHCTMKEIIKPTAKDDGVNAYVCDMCGEIVEIYIGEVAIGYTPGDINDDETVDNRDLIRLFKYLANIDVDVNELALDVNRDNKLNNKDLTTLFMYLSDYNIVLE